MLIIVTGTPGTGKTLVAKEISNKYKLKYVNLNSLIMKNKLYDYYDKKLMSYVIDVNKLNKFLIRFVRGKDLVIDSHLSHYLDMKYVDLCIVVKCDISVLKKRLEKRGYTKGKIRENMDAEIFDVCLVEANEFGHNAKVIDTSKGFKKRDLMNLIK